MLVVSLIGKTLGYHPKTGSFESLTTFHQIVNGSLNGKIQTQLV